jgi:hypothetical protein
VERDALAACGLMLLLNVLNVIKSIKVSTLTALRVPCAHAHFQRVSVGRDGVYAA